MRFEGDGPLTDIAYDPEFREHLEQANHGVFVGRHVA